jgi:Uma2 family endonuclease
MTTLSSPTAAPAAPSLTGQVERRGLTFEDYMCLAEQGRFGRHEKIELIHGEIVRMLPAGYRHFYTIACIHRWLNKKLGDEVLIGSQGTVRLRIDTAPEPDLVVFRQHARRLKRHIGPAEIHWIIEVAESSIAYDTQIKRQLYAAAGIAEYWVVDLNVPRLLIYRRPEHGDYAEQLTFNPDQPVAPAAFPEAAGSLNQIAGLDELDQDDETA